MKRDRPESSRPSPRPTRPGSVVLLVLASLLAIAWTQYPGLLGGQFVRDDFAFLDATRDASFAELWRPSPIVSHYYRPWSRELHYAVLQRFFGPEPAPFHVANLALWVFVGVAYFLFVARLGGTRTAALATAAAFSLPAWGVILLWASGSQDLWMLAFAFATWLAYERGRSVWAAGFLALALLSKETAAVVPAVAIAHALWIRRESPREALARTAPLLAVVFVWALLHPMIGGRLFRPSSAPPALGGDLPLTVVTKTLRSVLGLEEVARPETGWGPRLPSFGLALLSLVPLFVIARRGTVPPSSVPSLRARVGFGLTWTLLGWAPLLIPGVGWHAYYGLLGTLGAWFAIATLLARWPVAGFAAVALVGAIHAGRAATPSTDWGTEWHHRRAAWFDEHTRQFLARTHPRMPSHTRAYFQGVPGSVGLMPGGEESPILRVWYRDTTLEARFLSRYRARSASEPRGRDLFFRWDSLSGWREVTAGEEDLSRIPRGDTLWRSEHWDLFYTMAATGDWKAATVEGEKLARSDPSNATMAFNAGVARAEIGDSASAARWFARAARLPDALPEYRDAAKRFERFLER